MVEFKLQGIPPSYNKCFRVIFSLKSIELSPEARAFKHRVKLSTPHFEVSSTDRLNITIYYHSNWYYKNGSIMKKDLQNLDKLLIDAIAEKVGFNDCQFFECHFYKVQDKDSYMLVKIDKLHEETISSL